MFGKIKFYVLIPHDADEAMHHVQALKLMGVKIKDIREDDILDKNENRIFLAYILTCVASKKSFGEVKKYFEETTHYKGLPVLC